MVWQRLAAVCLLVCGVSAFPSEGSGPSNLMNPTNLMNTVSAMLQPMNITARQARFFTPEHLMSLQSALSGVLGGSQSYASNGLSNVLALNTGNLALVALVVGATLLLWPVIMGTLGQIGLGGPAAGKRSLNPNDPDNSANHMVVNFYKYIDDFFRQYNIDAPVCMQRFACNAARKSAMAVTTGRASTYDSVVNAILSSDYVSKKLGQTKFMAAVKYGKIGGSCEREYSTCPFSLEKVSQYFAIFGNWSPSSTPKYQ